MTREEKNAKAVENANKLLNEIETLYNQFYDMEMVIKARTREMEYIIDEDDFEYDDYADETQQEREYTETLKAIHYYIRNIEERFRW